jgi:hypothetical protein
MGEMTHGEGIEIAGLKRGGSGSGSYDMDRN